MYSTSCAMVLQDLLFSIIPARSCLPPAGWTGGSCGNAPSAVSGILALGVEL